MMGRRALLAAVLLSLTGCPASCGKASTEAQAGLMVIVSTDLQPSEYDEVRVEVSQEVTPGQFRSWLDLSKLVPSEVTLPTTVFIETGHSADQEVDVRVAAYLAGAPIVLREAQLQAPTNRIATLYFLLAESCKGQVQMTGAEGEPQAACTTGESCQPTTGMCGSSTIATSGLPTFAPEQLVEAGVVSIVSGGGSSSGGGASSGGSDDGGSSSGGAGDGGSSGADASSGGRADASTQDAGAAYDYSVYQHHKNGTRNGLYIDPVLTTSAAMGMHVLPTFMGTVSTNVYAQPLYVENGPGGVEAFIVATESNHVTAYSAASGATLWDQGPASYGAQITGGLPCGDITPLGITGTPFIDPASPINNGEGVIYFDAMTTPDGNTTAKHMVYAVKLSDGTALPNWPVDVSAKVTGFTSNVQNQRGALQLLNGVLYVPYGGFDGDCGNYYGWVVGFPVTAPQTPTGWHTAAKQGGIWGPGALPTDGTSIFPITGNTASGIATWGGGEAVIRLGAGPTFSGNAADYYAPADWQTLDDADEDLGGASEVLFDMPGASKPHLVAAGGKDSNLYLLDRDNLGGIGGELFKQSMASSQFKGAPIAYTTALGTYVAFHVEGGTGTGCSGATGGNLVAMKITGGAGNPTATVAWCAGQASLASPIVTTTDGTSNAIVWDANTSLWGYDGDTGAMVVSGTNTTMSTAIQGWNTPISVGQGRIAIAVNGLLYLFAP